MYKKTGNNQNAGFVYTLTAEQHAEVVKGGTLSFYYKANGVYNFNLCGVSMGTTSTDWTKIELNETQLAIVREKGYIKIQLVSTWAECKIYLDDIVVKIK